MIKLKSLKLKNRILQAPMAGYTDLAFRLIAREQGLEFAFAEMVLADAVVRRNAKTLALLKWIPEDKPLGAQIVGAKPDLMAEAAVILEELGFDLVDINCGCPARKIVQSGAGAALLKDARKTSKIFEAVVKRVKKIPVTIKIRKGFTDRSGAEALHLAIAAENSGISAVTVHGRTRCQGYSVPADWNIVRQIKEKVSIPVLGNGDIFSPGDAKQFSDKTGCDGVVIGRGGFGNPWIYRAAMNALRRTRPTQSSLQPSLKMRKQTALKHLKYAIQWEGEKIALLRFRHLGFWYFKGQPGAAKLRGRFHLLNSFDDVVKAISDLGP